MKCMNNDKKLIAIVALLAGGCGAFPDVIVETARERAIQTIENTVGHAVDDVIDGTIGELLDLDDLEVPFLDQGHEEEEESVDIESSGSDKSR